MPTNGMTIDGLNTVSALTAQDKVPVWDNESSGEPTRKITAQNFAAAIKTLANLLGTGDVVNDLTSTDPTKALAAPQGKALNDNLNMLENKVNNLYSVGGWYITQSLRGGTGYNDITINNIPNNSGTGFIIGTKGLYTFYTTETLVSASSGLTIENRGNNVYRFTFGSEWYKPVMLITSWNRS